MGILYHTPLPHTIPQHTHLDSVVPKIYIDIDISKLLSNMQTLTKDKIDDLTVCTN